MSFPAHPRCQESGVDWIGRVPEYWSINPLKRHFEVIGGSTPKSDDARYWDGDIVWVTPADLSRLSTPLISDSARRITSAGMDSCGTTLVPPHSIVLSTRAPIGSLAIAMTTLCTNQGCKSLIPGTDVHSHYVAYVLSSATVPLNLRGKGTTFLELSADELGAFKVPVPPHHEQQLIVTFLDRETAKIDALIAEQEKLIALLAEKRQATISHAVTRGLNSDALTRESGVEWVGEIPEHWKMTRLKSVASVQTGIAKGKDIAGKKTISVPYMRVANVQDGFLALDDVATLDIELESLDRYRLASGDVLMNEGGDFDKLGRGAIWRGEISNCIHQNHVFAVRPHSISSEWLNELTSARYAQFYFMTRSKQSTNLASIGSSSIMELPVLLPPIEEQLEILDFIASETGKLDALDRESERAISLLKERRSALIAAAVTGQIDVRGAIPQTVKPGEIAA